MLPVKFFPGICIAVGFYFLCMHLANVGKGIAIADNKGVQVWRFCH